MRIATFTSIITALLFVDYAYGQVQSIRNGVLWRDTDGNRIQAHSTDIVKHDGRYYMIGEDRSNNFSSYQGINLYVSDDLTNWEFLNKVVDASTNEQMGNPDLPRDEQRFTERPNLVYNEQTQQFVIWAKYQNPGFNANEVAVFYSSTIDGSYTFHKAFQPRGFDTNDCSFFRDDDGRVYFVTTHKGVNTPDNPSDNNSINLYELSDDYLDVKGDPAILFPGLAKEAPVIFKKDGLYYLLTSNKTGWRPNQGQYSTSTSLMSGWSAFRNFGNRINYDTQPTDVIILGETSGTPSYYYIGDRWWDPRLPESKTIMLPMTVDGDNVATQYVPEYTINMETGAWTAFDNNTYVPQNGWSLVSVSSQETSQTNNPATNAFDGDLSTIWHTRYSAGNDSNPHEIIIDLGANYDVSGFQYIPRQDNSPNGTFRDFQLFLSADTTDWGEPAASGWAGYWTELFFPQTTARYMRLVTYSTLQNTSQRFTAAAELRLLTSSEYNNEGIEINSYYQIDDNGFETGTEINISEGSRLILGPQAQFRGAQSPFFGSYSWSGPRNFYAGTRSVTFDSIDASQAGEYTLYYLDDKYHCHTETVTINLVVGNVTARGESPTEVVVAWEAYSGSTGYVVEYREAGGSFTELAQVGADETSYLHSGVTPGVRYEYRVAAQLDEETLSTYSDPASVTAPFIVVNYRPGNANRPEDNKIRVQWEFDNQADDEVSLNQLTMRYWFTVEELAPLNFHVDYAGMGKEAVAGTFVALEEPRPGADYYLEVSFDTDRTIAPQGTSSLVHTRITKSDWSDFDEADDYSYIDTRTYQPTERITVYWNGELVGGKEPKTGEVAQTSASRLPIENAMVYPNTARGETTVQYDRPIQTVSEIVLVDQMNVAHPVQVRQQGKQLQMQFPNLSPGPYIIKGSINGKPFTHRLLIE